MDEVEHRRVAAHVAQRAPRSVCAARSRSASSTGIGVQLRRRQRRARAAGSRAGASGCGRDRRPGATRSSTWNTSTPDHGTSSPASRRSITHGVCPPLTASTKRPRAVTAARAAAAITCAARAADGVGIGEDFNSHRSATVPRSTFHVVRSPPRPAPNTRNAQRETHNVRSSLLLLEVAAELVAHRRQQLVGEVGLAARAEALVEGGGQDVRRDAFVDRRPGCVQRPSPESETRPAKRCRARGSPASACGGQVEQPRRDDAAAPPHLGDVGRLKSYW